MGRFKLWELSRLAKEWLSNGAQFVVCELSPLFWFGSQIDYCVTSPGLIGHEIHLPDNINDLLNQPSMRSTRRSLTKAKRMGFEYSYTREIKDFDLYYSRMYLPYITKRHGFAASISSYEDQLKEFRRGGLILVKEGDKPAAGMLIVLKNKVCLGLEAGILDGDDELIHKDVYTFGYWAVIEWSIQQGAKSVDLGATSAWRSHGVFKYKNRCGGRVCRFRSIRSNLVYFLDTPSQEYLEDFNHKGIISEHHGRFYGVVLAPDRVANNHIVFDEELKKAVEDGLTGILVIYPNKKQYIHKSI